MEQCKICKKIFKNINGLAKHINNTHCDITKQQYYDLYIGEIESMCECGNHKKFRGIGEGYRQHCSHKCYSGAAKTREQRRLMNLGKKQTEETIIKRIANTDQVTKERNKKKTMMERYGVANCSQIPEISEKISKSNKGKVCPRTSDHQQKIVESKRQNGTNKHTDDTKKKISKSVNDTYQSDNPPNTLSDSSIKCHKSGHYEGFYYRSSYELIFLEYCVKNNIKVVSAETTEFRIPYIQDGKRKMYYPDFFIPSLNLLIEVKPVSMLNVGNNPNKIEAAKTQNKHIFKLVTEKELNNLSTVLK
jgi:hypothetical protein